MDGGEKSLKENLKFIFWTFLESSGSTCMMELEKLLDILKHSHDCFKKIFNRLIQHEMQENISLASFSSRLASQIWSEMQSDFLQNFIICNTTQHFIRPSKVPIILVQKPSVSLVKPNFYSGFVSSPWLIRALLDHLSNKISTLEPMITGLQAVVDLDSKYWGVN